MPRPTLGAEAHKDLTVILVAMSSETDCVFCQIVAGSMPANITYEDADTIAFPPLVPAAEGHTLVVPRLHARTLLDIAPASAGALMIAATLVARIIDRDFHPDGMTMFQTNEPAGWQSVFHVHLHIVPRWENDDLIKPWEVVKL
jgi:histidine triad (HIT) family protein